MIKARTGMGVALQNRQREVDVGAGKIDGRDVIVSVVQASNSGKYIAMISWKDYQETFVEKTAYVLGGNLDSIDDASREAMRSVQGLDYPFYPEYHHSDIITISDGDRAGIQWEPPFMNGGE